jgi:hypothetical protein
MSDEVVVVTRSMIHNLVREVWLNSPSRIRRAVLMMRRRGVGWKNARRAVLIVNAAIARENYSLAVELNKNPENYCERCGVATMNRFCDECLAIPSDAEFYSVFFGREEETEP